jgi:hypothetical protein
MMAEVEAHGDPSRGREPEPVIEALRSSLDLDSGGGSSLGSKSRLLSQPSRRSTQ